MDESNQSSSKKAEKKSRGVLLALFIVISAFGLLSTILTLLNPAFNESAYGGNVPWWVTPYTIIGGIISAALLYGVWTWRKWTIYVYLLSAGLGVTMSLLVFPNVIKSYNIAYTLMALVPSVIWFWVLYRKRKEFTE